MTFAKSNNCLSSPLSLSDLFSSLSKGKAHGQLEEQNVKWRRYAASIDDVSLASEPIASVTR